MKSPTKRSILGFFLLLFSFSLIPAKAQIIEWSYFWHSDSTRPHFERQVSKLRKEKVWYGKRFYKDAEFTFRLELLDSNSFRLTETPHIGPIVKEVTYGIVFQDTSLLLHGENYGLGSNGDTLKKGAYKLGLRHGPFQIRQIQHKDTLDYSYGYTNGKLDGPFLLKKNQLALIEGAYNLGYQTGKWNYYQEGQLYASGSYARTFHTDSIHLVGHRVWPSPFYEHLELQNKSGKWSFYLPNGNLEREEYYDKKGQLSKVKFIAKYHGLLCDERLIKLEYLIKTMP